MNYQILNYLGEEVISSISQVELDTMMESNEFNMFEWDGSDETHIITGFQTQLIEDPSLVLDNLRIYKLIHE